MGKYPTEIAQNLSSQVWSTNAAHCPKQLIPKFDQLHFQTWWTIKRRSKSLGLQDAEHIQAATRSETRAKSEEWQPGPWVGAGANGGAPAAIGGGSMARSGCSIAGCNPKDSAILEPCRPVGPLFANLGNQPVLGNLDLGTFAWEPLLGNLYLGTFTWEPCGRLHQRDLYLATLLGNLSLGTLEHMPFPLFLFRFLCSSFSFSFSSFPLLSLLFNLLFSSAFQEVRQTQEPTNSMGHQKPFITNRPNRFLHIRHN